MSVGAELVVNPWSQTTGLVGLHTYRQNFHVCGLYKEGTTGKSALHTQAMIVAHHAHKYLWDNEQSQVC